MQRYIVHDAWEQRGTGEFGGLQTNHFLEKLPLTFAWWVMSQLKYTKTMPQGASINVGLEFNKLLISCD